MAFGKSKSNNIPPPPPVTYNEPELGESWHMSGATSRMNYYRQLITDDPNVDLNIIATRPKKKVTSTAPPKPLPFAVGDRVRMKYRMNGNSVLEVRPQEEGTVVECKQSRGGGFSVGVKLDRANELAPSVRSIPSSKLELVPEVPGE